MKGNIKIKKPTLSENRTGGSGLKGMAHKTCMATKATVKKGKKQR